MLDVDGGVVEAALLHCSDVIGLELIYWVVVDYFLMCSPGIVFKTFQVFIFVHQIIFRFSL